MESEETEIQQGLSGQMELTPEMIEYLKKVTPGIVAMYIFDEEVFEPVYLSPEIASLNGMTPEEFVGRFGKNAAAAIMPQDMDIVLDALHESVRTGKQFDCYFRVFHKTLGYDWAHANARICGSMHGKAVFLTTYINDTAEADVYQRILDHSDTMAYVTDCNTYEILYANRAAREYGGRDKGISYGKKCYEYIRSKDAPCENCFLKDLKHGSALCRKSFNSLKNTWERISGEYITWSGHDAFVQYITDVTDSEVRQHELEAVINNIPVGVSMTRVRNGKPIAKITNPLLCDLYGIKNEDAGLSDQIATERVAGEDKAEMIEKMQSLLTPGTAVKYIFRYFRDGKNDMRWYQMNSRSVSFGDELLLFSCLSDITAEREAESALQRSRQMYEAATELAELGVWTYDIPNHRIILSDGASVMKDRKTFSIPKVIENVPESNAEWVDEEDMDTLRELYRKIDNGAPNASCEYWYKKKKGIQPRCERTFYTTVFDGYGKPLLAYGIGMDITPQKQQEENYLRTIETLMTANPDTIVAFRLNLTNNICSEGHYSYRYIKDFGMPGTADEFIDKVLREIPYAKERKKAAALIGREKLISDFEKGKSSVKFEYRRLGKDDKISWARAYYSIMRNPNTGDIECIAYAQDISKVKRDEEIFKSITNREYDYVAILHMKDNLIEFVTINKDLPEKYQKVLGREGRLLDFDEMREFTASSWIDEEDRKMYLENSKSAALREHLDKNGNCEMSLRGHTVAHPEETMCRKIQHYYLNDDKDTVLIIQTDVTLAYRSQQEEAKRINDILDSVSTGICVLHMPDRDHLTGSYVNLPMFRILGYDPDGTKASRREIEATPEISSYLKDAFLVVYAADRKRIKKVFHDNYESQSFTTGNYRIRRKDGKIIWLDQELILRDDTAEGKTFYATYKVMDKEIELQEELERQIEEEKTLRLKAITANEAKSEFLSRMSHDIRTPLNGIIGMSYIAHKQNNPTKTEDCLNKIDTSSKFLLGLINDILDMSKAESNKIELCPEAYSPEEFTGYIDAVIRPLCKDKSQNFAADINMPEKFIPIMDKLRVNQIVFNLLSNAVKYTPEFGTIKYSVKFIALSPSRASMTINVSDNGIGMSDGFQKVLFDPFMQEGRNDISEKRGSGLGLAIAKKMVELMKGTISVKSKIGAGTTFTVRMDVDYIMEEDAKKAANKKNTGNVSALTGKHILICEDHPLNREIVKALFDEKRIISQFAENGQEGVELFRNSIVGFYDAIMMDIRMPVMDGYEATKQIRALSRDDAKKVPIFAMTADAFSDDVKKCIDAGMNGHIAKPIDPQKMYALLADI